MTNIETGSSHNPIERQKELLSGHGKLRAWDNERVIPLYALQETDVPSPHKRIAMGYCIVDGNMEEEALVLGILPSVQVSAILWQGDMLKEKLGKSVVITPVSVTDKANGREVQVGWRVHTKDELPKEQAENVRSSMITALSELVDDDKLERCTDTELCLMIILLQNNDIKQVHAIAETSYASYRISRSQIRDEIGDLVDRTIEANQASYRYNSRGSGI